MFQHAYRPSHSTCTAITQMYDSWLTSIDNSNLVGTVLLDFSAAFDVIDHNILISKLVNYGFKSSAIMWFRSYLSARSQRVYFNGALSSSRVLDCGVPQGSCLGPLLFSIFTNDMPYSINNANLTMYADDSTLYYAAPTCTELNHVLSNELSIIYNWIKTNKLVLNISKTICIIFGSNYRLSYNPKMNLQIEDQIIQQVKTVKLLGLWLDCALSWSDHVNKVVAKMGRAIAITRKCASFVTPLALHRIVCSLVLCHLDYCSVAWSSASKGLLGTLQVAQNRAARLVLGCSPRTSVVDMHKRLTWLTVEQRLSANLHLHFHKVIQTQTPRFIFNNIIYSSNVHTHSTRAASRGQMTLPRPKTNYMKKTVIDRSIAHWNSLPDDVSSIKGRACFKRMLRSHLQSHTFSHTH